MSTLTLRPNAAGDETSITYQWPNSTYHWDKVDEVTPDNDTYVFVEASSYKRDLYSLPDHTTESGTINSIKIYFRCHSDDVTHCRAKPSLKSDSTVTDGTEITPTQGVWTTYSETWTTNPADSAAWEWADIDALQIGVSLYGYADDGKGSFCTQVYVVVDYTMGFAPYYYLNANRS